MKILGDFFVYIKKYLYICRINFKTKIMKEQLISFETAKLAKKKGFNTPCRNYSLIKDKISQICPYEGSSDNYWGDNRIVNWNTNEVIGIKPFNGFISIPTQSLLQKWLREIHNIEVYVRPFINAENHNKHYRCFIVWFDGRIYHDGTYFAKNTYEEALEAGLQEALKLIN